MFIVKRKNNQVATSRIALLSGVIIALSLLTSLFIVTPIQAKMDTKTPPNDRAKSYSYWKATSKCVRDHMRSTIYTVAGENGATSPKQGGFGGIEGTKEGEWFDDLTAHVSVYPDGKQNCDQVMKKAMSLWGWSDGKEFLDDMGFKFNSDKPAWERTNDTSDKRFEGFKSAVLSQVGNVVDLLDGAAKYQLYLGSFTSSKTELSTCGGKQITTLASADKTISDAAKENKFRDGVNYTVITVVEGAKPVDYVYTYSANQESSGDNTTGVTLANHATTWNYRSSVNNTGGEGERFTCKDIVKKINDNASSYARWAAVPGAEDTLPPGGTVGGGNEGCTGSAEECTPKSSCTIEGVGWIVCPVINFMAGLADGAFGFLADTFLRTDPTAFTTDTDTYRAWEIMRNIGNVLFVIAFLIIIFSQLTGMGVSNYGVKKMLPRLVVAAILVNLSFFVSQIAIDLSNILGYSIRDVFSSVAGQIRPDTYQENVSVLATGDSFTNIAVTILAGVGSVVVMYALLSTFGTVVLAAVLALVMMLFILIARQAIVILLVVLSPIAFVALLLPNTERFFKFWRQTLVAMLLLFPLIALVFGASTLASTVLQGSFTGAFTGEGSNVFGQVVASAVLVLPLFAIPYLLKKSLDGIPMLGQMASRWQGKANSKLSGGLKESYKGSKFGRGRAIRQRAKENYRAKKFSEGLTQGGVMGGFNRVAASGLPVTKTELAANQALMKAASAATLRAEKEEVEDAKSLIEMSNLSGAQRQQLALTGSTTDSKGRVLKGDVLQKASIQLQMGGAGSVGDMHAILAKSSDNSASGLGRFSQTISQGALSMGSKDPAITSKRIDQISQGTFNYETAVKQAIGEGKYTAEAFASMNDDARGKAIAIARTAEQNGDPSLILALKGAASGIQSSSEINARIAGNRSAQDQINSLLGQAPSQTVQAAKDTAARAAEGTAGSGTFVAGSGGITAPTDGSISIDHNNPTPPAGS